jgi:hypothetical protein
VAIEEMNERARFGLAGFGAVTLLPRHFSSSVFRHPAPIPRGAAIYRNQRSDQR